MAEQKKSTKWNDLNEAQSILAAFKRGLQEQEEKPEEEPKKDDTEPQEPSEN